MTRPVPGLPIEQQPLPVLRRLLVFGEARGEPLPGMLAILCVVQNRSKDGVTQKQVILKPKAFSCFNPGPHRDKMMNGYEAEPKSWAVVDAICDLWENGCCNDITRGATHYYAYNIVSPVWGRGHADWKETVTIGNHVYGNCP